MIDIDLENVLKLEDRFLEIIKDEEINIYTDGASRNNPGIAGAGILIT